MSCQKWFLLFPSKTFIQAVYVFIALSDISDTVLNSLISNVYKLQKNFDYIKTERSFRFVWFEEFPWVCYSWWEDGAYCLPCVLFCHKFVRSSILDVLYKKFVSIMANSSQNIKNLQNVTVLFNVSGLCNLGPDTLRKPRDNIVCETAILHGWRKVLLV